MFVELTDSYRRGFRRGMQGWDVAVLQLNLRACGFAIAVDGDFGPRTEAAVRDYQTAHRLVVDGIAGQRTQQSIGLVLSTEAQNRYRTPGGMLRGIMEGESGWWLAAVTKRYRNGSRDVGAYQENLSAAELQEESALRAAFDVSVESGFTAKKLRHQKDTYYGQPGAQSHMRAWRWTILYHNWPAAANRMAAGTDQSWEYTARDRNGVYRQYTLSERADWIVDIGVAGVETGYQWINHYVDSKTLYVREWTA